MSELPWERRLNIQDLAECVFEDYWGDIPVNPESIIKDCGITLSYGNYEGCFDGSLEHRRGRFHIYCDISTTDHLGSPRVRFTLSHELGHYFIDDHRTALAKGSAPQHGSFIYDSTGNRTEQEADFFAASLLMPQKRFSETFDSSSVELQSTLDISSTFSVSAQCAAIRCIQQRNWPAAIVMFREGKKPWWCISDALIHNGYRYFRRLDNYRPLAGSATFEAQQPLAASWKIISTTTTATTWFSGVGEASSRNAILTEQAVRLGPYGVLTMLKF